MQKEFKKQQRRLRNIIKRGQSNGFVFDQKQVEAIERTPNRITKASVERLKKLDSKTLYKKATKQFLISGIVVVLKGEKARELDRKIKRSSLKKDAIETVETPLKEVKIKSQDLKEVVAYEPVKETGNDLYNKDLKEYETEKFIEDIHQFKELLKYGFVSDWDEYLNLSSEELAEIFKQEWDDGDECYESFYWEERRYKEEHYEQWFKENYNYWIATQENMDGYRPYEWRVKSSDKTYFLSDIKKLMSRVLNGETIPKDERIDLDELEPFCWDLVDNGKGARKQDPWMEFRGFEKAFKQAFTSSNQSHVNDLDNGF